MPLTVVLCFLRGTEGQGTGISVLRQNQSTGFDKPASSFSHVCELYEGIFTYYAQFRVCAKASLDRGLWIGIFVLHNFRGLCANKLQLISHKRVQGSVIDCTCPLPALWSNHICLVYVSPFSLHESVKQTKEREVMEKKSKAMWVQSVSQRHKTSRWKKLGTILPLISKITRFSHLRCY